MRSTITLSDLLNTAEFDIIEVVVAFVLHFLFRRVREASAKSEKESNNIPTSERVTGGTNNNTNTPPNVPGSPKRAGHKRGIRSSGNISSSSIGSGSSFQLSPPAALSVNLSLNSLTVPKK